MKLKYIVFDDCLPVVFHEGISHNKVRAGNPINSSLKATSAGFCTVKDNKVSTFGESSSLGLKPGKFDGEILTKMLFGK